MIVKILSLSDKSGLQKLIFVEYEISWALPNV